MEFGLVLSTKEHLYTGWSTNTESKQQQQSVLVAYCFHCLEYELYFMITLNSVVAELEVRLSVFFVEHSQFRWQKYSWNYI